MNSPPFQLIAVIIIKNEASYLEEWLSYHLTQGVEHFVIYDNGSVDATCEVLTRFVNHGIATLVNWPLVSGQTDAYRHSHFFFGHLSEWLAFLDIDEFVQTDHAQTVSDWLKSLPEDVSQVLLPWRNFLPSGHYTRPPGLVIESYNRSEPAGAPLKLVLSKPIVRASDVLNIHVHRCGMKTGRTIDPQGNPPPGSDSRIPANYTVVFINHFYYRSVEEYRNKIQRGQVDGGKEKIFRDLDVKFVESGGIYTPIQEELIEDTRSCMQDLLQYSPAPATYGSHLLGGRLGHNMTQWKFNISCAAFLNGFKSLSLSPGPIDYVYQDFGTSIFSFADCDSVTDFFSSIHFSDFLRHSRSHITSNLKSPTLSFTNPGFKQRKVFILATVESRPSDNLNDIGLEDGDCKFEVCVSSSSPIAKLSVGFKEHRSVVLLVFKYIPHSYFAVEDGHIEYSSHGLTVHNVFLGLQD